MFFRKKLLLLFLCGILMWILINVTVEQENIFVSFFCDAPSWVCLLYAYVWYWGGPGTQNTNPTFDFRYVTLVIVWTWFNPLSTVVNYHSDASIMRQLVAAWATSSALNHENAALVKYFYILNENHKKNKKKNRSWNYHLGILKVIKGVRIGLPIASI